MIVVAYSSDRHRDRAYHATAGALICLIGYIILVVCIERPTLYAGACIAVAGIFVINPIVNAWLTSNIAPDMKKSVATAMAVSANNSAGLVGSNIYRKSDAPRYRKCVSFMNKVGSLFLLLVRGHMINLGFLVLFIILTMVQRYLLYRKNQLKEQEKMKLTEEQIEQMEDNDARVGDEAVDFVYRL